MDHLPLGSSSVVRSSPLAASPSMRSISRVALSIFIIRLLAHRDPASSANLFQLISVLSARSSVRPDAIVLVLNAVSSDSPSLFSSFSKSAWIFLLLDSANLDVTLLAQSYATSNSSASSIGVSNLYNTPSVLDWTCSRMSNAMRARSCLEFPSLVGIRCFRTGYHSI